MERRTRIGLGLMVAIIIALGLGVRAKMHEPKAKKLQEPVMTLEVATKVLSSNCTNEIDVWSYEVADNHIASLRIAPDGRCAKFFIGRNILQSAGMTDVEVEAAEDTGLIKISSKSGLPAGILGVEGVYLGSDKQGYVEAIQKGCTTAMDFESPLFPNLSINPDTSALIGVLIKRSPVCHALFNNRTMLETWGIDGTGYGWHPDMPVARIDVPNGMPVEFFSDEPAFLEQYEKMKQHLKENPPPMDGEEPQEQLGA